MPPGISARALRAGSENTTSRSNRPRKVCVFCRSGCPRRVPGSIPSNPGGCMANGPSLSPTGCFRPSSWLSASVLMLAVPMNHICLFPKRSRDYALGPHVDPGNVPVGDEQVTSQKAKQVDPPVGRVLETLTQMYQEERYGGQELLPQQQADLHTWMPRLLEVFTGKG